MSNNDTRLTLIQRLKAEHSDKSWEEFVRVYEGYVYVILRRLDFSDEDCQDIKQACFLKVWKSVESFDHRGRKGQFRKWLSLIAKNTAYDFLDKKKNNVKKQENLKNNQPELHEVPSEIDQMAEEEWEIYITTVAWKNVKDSLNETLHRIFKMILDGKSRQEMARELEIPLNTVSVYKSRLTKIIQKEIKRLESIL